MKLENFAEPHSKVCATILTVAKDFSKSIIADWYFYAAWSKFLFDLKLIFYNTGFSIQGFQSKSRRE